MNIFELNLYASPVGGFVGGVTAAKAIPAASMLLAGGIGLGIGAGLYFGIFGAGWLALKVAGLDKARDDKGLDRAASIMGVVVFLPMFVLPILSGLAAHWIVGWLWR